MVKKTERNVVQGLITTDPNWHHPYILRLCNTRLAWLINCNFFWFSWLNYNGPGQHLLTVLLTIPFNYLPCHRQYTSARGLQQHLYSFHERKKSGSYDCFFCGDLFLQESKLKHHIKIKHKDREYECLKCKASYKSEWSLHMHIEHVHEGKRYQCSDCGEVYDSLTKLDTHIG